MSDSAFSHHFEVELLKNYLILSKIFILGTIPGPGCNFPVSQGYTKGGEPPFAAPAKR